MYFLKYTIYFKIRCVYDACIRARNGLIFSGLILRPHNVHDPAGRPPRVSPQAAGGEVPGTAVAGSSCTVYTAAGLFLGRKLLNGLWRLLR